MICSGCIICIYIYTYTCSTALHMCIILGNDHSDKHHEELATKQLSKAIQAMLSHHAHASLLHVCCFEPNVCT